MSDCFTNNDLNWPDSTAFLPWWAGPYRPAIARVWHGMLLVATTAIKPGQSSGSVEAYVYDPYAREYGSSFFTPPVILGTASSAPAIWYADLVTYIFYWDGTNLVYRSAPQPSLNPQNNAIQFASLQFGAPSVVAANVQASNPAVVLFDGSVYVFWSDMPAAGQTNTFSYASAPYTAGFPLKFSALEKFPLVGGAAISEPSVCVWRGDLYMAYVCPGQGISMNRYLPSSTGWQRVGVSQAFVGTCGILSSSFAPALAPDPKGSFLMMIFCKNGSHQLCSTYLVPGNLSNWTEPQIIQGQSTPISASVITTSGNYGYLAYVTEIGIGTILATSDALPLVQP